MAARKTTKQKKAAKVKATMHEWKAGTLNSGSKSGPVVTSQKQAVAIALSQAAKIGKRKKTKRSK